MLTETLFPVKEVPAIGSPVEIDDKEIDSTGYKFIVREDTGDVLSCMTDEYRLVTNEDLMKTTKPILKSVGAHVREAKTLQGGKKTQWTFTIPSVKVDIGKGDTVSPEVIIKNSYDGSWELGIMAGAFRLVCSNGAVIGILLEKKSNRHSIYNPNLDNIGDLIVDTVERTSRVFKEDFVLLKETNVNQADIKKLIEMIPSNVMEGFTNYLCAHKPNNYWDLFNAATWVNTHHMNRSHTTTHKFGESIYPSIKKWATTVAEA